MDQRERINDFQESLRAAFDGRLVGLWTALPGIINSNLDTGKMTVTVRPAIKARVRDNKGNFSWVELPLLQDVPVLFPGGGGFTLTFPVKVGDECLVVFSSRCIDAWWQSGGIQVQPEFRLHDLSDGFAIVGPRSKPRVLSGLSTTAAQLRSDDGACLVELGAAEITVKAPTVTVQGNLVVQGTVQATGEGTFNSHTVSAHVHGGVQSGSSNTGTPVG